MSQVHGVASIPKNDPTNGTHTTDPAAVVDLEARQPPQECRVKKNLKLVVLILRASVLLFCVISFLLMVTLGDFTNYPALSYVFTTSILVVVYTVVFIGIHGHELRTGEVVIPPKVAAWINFLGDQILALMLLSAGSAGGETTLGGRQVYGNHSGVETASASVAMALIASFALEAAALISGHILSKLCL